MTTGVPRKRDWTRVKSGMGHTHLLDCTATLSTLVLFVVDVRWRRKEEQREEEEGEYVGERERRGAGGITN